MLAAWRLRAARRETDRGCSRGEQPRCHDGRWIRWCFFRLRRSSAGFAEQMPDW